MTEPLAQRHAYNDSDLRYLRESLRAAEAAHGTSAVAVERAIDPRVRALARRTHAAQADDIREVRSLLLGWAPHERSSGRVTPVTPTGVAATPENDLGSLAGSQVDRRFLQILAECAEASLVRARTEMVEGFGGPSRSHAENSGQASWLELAALNRLAPVFDRS